jgi:hypothetical protein
MPLQDASLIEPASAAPKDLLAAQHLQNHFTQPPRLYQRQQFYHDPHHFRYAKLAVCGMDPNIFLE